MSELNTKRESDKIRELARDYRKRGYRVSITPHGQALPEFLRRLGYSPDLIAISKEESHVVEVSSRDTAGRLRELSEIVNAIEQRHGWQFVLVMTNPREPEAIPVQAAALRIEDLQAPLEHVKSLAEISARSENKYDHAVLLSAWSVVEAALRMYLYSNKREKEGRSPSSIVRDSVMYGFITPEEGQFLDSVVRLRNGVAHGGLKAKVPESTLNRILALCDSLTRELKP
jgi:uncharacterized protein YutE (UPF0331/DUF86 family)